MSSTKIESTNMSLCIPRVFPNITWKRVKDVFEELGLGQVERVDLVKKTNEKGEEFKRGYVHFKFWKKNKTVDAVKAKLESGDFVKVVYDDPWFWKVYKSDAPKPVFEKKQVAPKKGHKVPRLVDGDEHPGSLIPVASTAGSELAELKAMMMAQQAEMSLLRQQLLAERSAEAPKVDAEDKDDDIYRPCSPVDEPPTLRLKKPKLSRQTAVSRGRDSPLESEDL